MASTAYSAFDEPTPDFRTLGSPRPLHTHEGYGCSVGASYLALVIHSVARVAAHPTSGVNLQSCHRCSFVLERLASLAGVGCPCSLCRICRMVANSVQLLLDRSCRRLSGLGGCISCRVTQLAGATFARLLEKRAVAVSEGRVGEWPSNSRIERTIGAGVLVRERRKMTPLAAHPPCRPTRTVGVIL
jgi:hypothetical protein